MLSGKAKIAGVIGNPVAHSLSPLLHGYWLEKYGIDGAYIPLKIAPDDLRETIKSLPKMGFRGVNITVPHKEIALLLADEVDDTAQRIGAANTLYFNHQRGTVFASNTDAYGFMENIRTHIPQWSGKNKKAVVIGAGGASRAVCVALMDAGIAEIVLVNRTQDRAENVAKNLGKPIRVEAWERRSDVLEGASILVNASTLGMQGYPLLDIALERLPAEAVVTDIVYAPLMTDLLEVAQERGNPVIDGLGMLLHQARPGFRGWFDVEPEVDNTLREHILKAIG